MSVQTKIIELLAENFGIPQDEITEDSTFEELDLDSLDLVEFSMAVEDQLGVKIEDEEAAELKTVNDAVKLLESKGAKA